MIYMYSAYVGRMSEWRTYGRVHIVVDTVAGNVVVGAAVLRVRFDLTFVDARGEKGIGARSGTSKVW